MVKRRMNLWQKHQTILSIRRMAFACRIVDGSKMGREEILNMVPLIQAFSDRYLPKIVELASQFYRSRPDRKAQVDSFVGWLSA